MAEPNLYPDYPTPFRLGHHVSRDADTLPQTTIESLFTIAGGRVLITLLFGTVTTTAIQNSDPVAKLTANPTTGTSVDIASTVDLSSLEIGGFIVCEGDTSALIKCNAGAGYGANLTPWIANTGTIDLETGASKTGSVAWDLWYVPLDAGASVVAA